MMKIISLVQPFYCNAERTAITALVHFEGMPDAIPFTATRDDGVSYGADLFDALVAGEYGDIAPYVESDEGDVVA